MFFPRKEILEIEGHIRLQPGARARLNWRDKIWRIYQTHNR